MYCSRQIDEIIPSFRDAYDYLLSSGETRWDREYDEAYKFICKERGLDPLDDNESASKDAWKEVEGMAEIAYDQIVDVIRKAFDGKDETTVYRAMVVPSADDFAKGIKEGTNWRGVGIYWAWDSDHAIVYWDDKAASFWGKNAEEEIIIEAVVSCDDVDAFETIVAYLAFSEGNEYDTEGDENEMRLKGGRKVFLKAAYKNVDLDEPRITDETIKIDIGEYVKT